MGQPWYLQDPPESIIPNWVTKKINERPQVKTPGTPKISAKMQKAMEQGRMLEASVGDAVFNLKQAKKDLEEKVAHFVSLNWVATDCYLPDKARPIKLAITVIKLIKKIQNYVNEIMDVLNALLDVLMLLPMLLAQLQAYLQNILNQIATLMNEICNLRLPDLPSFSVRFGRFKFSGFSFNKSEFKFKLAFDKNFAFGACKIRKPNVTNTLGLPHEIKPEVKLGNGLIIVQMQDVAGPLGIPDRPLPGVGSNGVITNPALLTPLGSSPSTGAPTGSGGSPSSGAGTPTSGDTSVIPMGIESLRNPGMYPTNVPIFAPDYNPHSDLKGSLPKPESILNDYQLPADQYENNVLSLVGDELGVPALFTDLNVVSDTTLFVVPNAQGKRIDPFDMLPVDEQKAIMEDLGNLDAIGGWTEPDSKITTGTGSTSGWGDGTASPRGLGGLGLSKSALITLYRSAKAYCREHVNLEALDDCTFKPHVTSAWLRYMNRARTARKGVWVESYQRVWDIYIQPSLKALNKPIRWNKDLKTNKVYDGEDSDFALNLKNMKKTKPEVYRQIMWLLSYLEASMLGYTRSTRWDGDAQAKGINPDVDTLIQKHITGFSRDQIDYTPFHAAMTPTVRIVLDHDGKALYPSSIQCPEQLEMRVKEAIEIGKKNIEANTTWRTSLTQFAHGYTAYGETQPIDRYSQFWREWSHNFSDMLEIPEPLRSFVFGYTLALNSFCNPLAEDIQVEHDKGEIYKRLKRDVMLRDWREDQRTAEWKPGQPSLPAPVVQLVDTEPALVDVVTDDKGNPIENLLRRVNAKGLPLDPNEKPFGNGWSSGEFDPKEFLDRPDIKTLSPNVQLRMMECHQAAQDIEDIKRRHTADIEALITSLEDEVKSGIGALEGFKNLIDGQLAASHTIMSAYPLKPTPIKIPGGTFKNSTGGSVSIPDQYSPTPSESPMPPAGAILPIALLDKLDSRPRILMEALQEGKVGMVFEDRVACTGGSADYTWTITGLPEGLTFTPYGSSCVIQGTPTKPFSRDITIKVMDAVGFMDIKTFFLRIARATVSSRG